MLLTQCYSELRETFSSIQSLPISAERIQVLQIILEALRSEDPEHETHLNYICTHNSRRSQLSQVWSACVADLTGFHNWHHHSAGTEATAFHPNALDTLVAAGFQIEKSVGENPRVQVKWRDDHPGITCYSKTIDQSVPEHISFFALMTCGDADENCPFIPKAKARLPFRFKDPKVSDGTPEQRETYRKRSHQIASELLWIFNRLKQQA
jgi:arsenate reductase (thioredoxin)